MKSFTSTTVLLASVASGALAQNTTLPFAACLLPCDQAALAKVGCAASDIPCHCEKAPETFSILVPCVLGNSTCGASATTDLLAFGKFASDSCVAINMTATDITAYLNTTTGSNTTGSSSPSPTVYDGAAMKIAKGSVWAAIAGAVGLALVL